MKKTYNTPAIRIITLQHSTQLLQASQKQGQFTETKPVGGWSEAQSKGWQGTDFWEE